jgi:hypothetical protein
VPGTDLHIAIALNVGKQGEMLRLRRSYRRRRSYQAEFGTARAVLSDKSDEMGHGNHQQAKRSPTLHRCR